MVIEQLTFSVPLPVQDQFLALDRDIWTTTLAAQPGFLGKEAWREAAAPDRLHLIIRWASRADWHAVPRAILDEAGQRFSEALGVVFPVLRCIDQDVLAPVP